MNTGEAILSRLAGGGSVTERVMIVVAHPDDETIGLGAQLGRFEDALLVHLTDGAPRDGEDARNYGFASVADYAAARRAELAAALRTGGAAQLRRLDLGIPDKEAGHDLAGLALQIADLLRAEEPAAVFTHAYEGGHPDHDSAAFAVHTACRLAASAPIIVEMPFYHRGDGRFVSGEFLPSPSPPPTGPSRRKPGFVSQPTEQRRGESRLWPGLLVHSITIAGEALRRKRRIIECFATQRWMLERFDLSVERFRVAPEYDFRELPHPGELHYETLGWGTTGEEWRRAASEALDRLGLVPLCH